MSVYKSKIGRRSRRIWGLIVLYFAASALGGCQTLQIHPRFAPTETRVAVRATIRLILDEDTKGYVWTSNYWGYKVEFGKVLETAAQTAFGRAFAEVQYGEAPDTVGAPDVRTVALKLLNVDVSLGLFTFSTVEAFMRLEATVVRSQHGKECVVTAQGNGAASPGAGWYSSAWWAIPNRPQDLRHKAAVRDACEKAVVDALEKIVDQTVTCW